MPECCSNSNRLKGNEQVDFTIALAGNANVGKSTIFNQLTGLNQTIGNWPGKTVEIAEGLLQYNGKKVKVVDLPGIYSFSTFSEEELVSREYIAKEKPDVAINIVDATNLERNLYFTLQLIELNVPLILVLNFADLLKKRKINIDKEKLGQMLGIPVIETAAVSGRGVETIIDKTIKIKNLAKQENRIKYNDDLEKEICKISEMIGKEIGNIGYAPRWIAIKLLENDSEVTKIISEKNKGLSDLAKKSAERLEKIYHKKINVLLSGERYEIIENIVKETVRIEDTKESLTEKLDKIALNNFFGYLLVIGVIGGLLVWTFIIGNFISIMIANFLGNFETLNPVVSGSIDRILWNGIFTGFVAGITLIIPYVLPFYLLLAILENSGYLPRIAFMLDKMMHKLGLHGKAIIPLLLGYGCNVPACFACRIMETKKQKLISAFLITLVPCMARTLVILGLVAAFVNIWWALALYVFDILLIIILGRIAFKVLPGESVGLIMEMPAYHFPHIKTVLKQTWARTKSLLIIVFPAYIIGSAIIQLLYSYGFLDPINNALSIITVSWLGLPAVTGILLIFGIVRKELTLLMLAVMFNTTNFATILTPVQMIVLGLVSMIYIPCLATILALQREFGIKKALLITIFEIILAILLGGLAFRFLTAIGV